MRKWLMLSTLLGVAVISGEVALQCGPSGTVPQLKWLQPALAALPPAQPAVDVPVSNEGVPLPAEFSLLSEAYLDDLFKASPTSATESGIHTYDGQLPDMSQKAMEEKVTMFKGYMDRFQKMDPHKLSRYDQVDRQLILNDIKSHLLELQDVQMWRRNPDAYSSAVSSAAFALIKRNFAPLEERLKSVISREKLVPGLLNVGKENMQNPPRIYTEIALEQMPGIISFFQKDLPAAFTSVKDESLKAEFKTTNDKVIQQLTEFQHYLKQDLLPKSNGKFALGAENYRRKLLYEEMIDRPIDQLLTDGYAELHRLQKQFIDTAREIDPSKPALAVVQEVCSDHPKSKEVISSTQAGLEGLRSYCVEHGIVTIPSEERVKVDETPPFMRALTFASMDTPGPFEKNAKEAYYFVTLPEPGWTAAKTEEHMRFFSRLGMLNTSVHEAYPGHYVQFLWNNGMKSNIRKVLGCGSNSEGWAHYCEQMMLDEGFGNGDKKLRLVQLQDALLRNCRYIVGLEMHTKNMSLEDAIKFFSKEGYQEHANGEREAKRGTQDPTYLVYTLGKLQILKLRDDYKAAHPKDYSLKEFHDQFLGQGYPPLTLVRAAMLNEPIPGTQKAKGSL